MYIVQVKTPAESKGDWDFYKILKTMKGDEAFGKLADSACPLVKKYERIARATPRSEARAVRAVAAGQRPDTRAGGAGQFSATR